MLSRWTPFSFQQVDEIHTLHLSDRRKPCAAQKGRGQVDAHHRFIGHAGFDVHRPADKDGGSRAAFIRRTFAVVRRIALSLFPIVLREVDDDRIVA